MMKMYRAENGTMLSEWNCPKCGATLVNATVNVGLYSEEQDELFLLCPGCSRGVWARMHPDKDPPVMPMA